MFGISQLAKKVGGKVKKGASNVARGRGAMGNRTSPLSHFRDWKDKQARGREAGGPPGSMIQSTPAPPAPPKPPAIPQPSGMIGAAPQGPAPAVNPGAMQQMQGSFQSLLGQPAPPRFSNPAADLGSLVAPRNLGWQRHPMFGRGQTGGF